ncbi:hypothetical protein Snoj_25300 [Streptomyces nojiriensis]|uniref:Uncharacterized protein n=1 Tax=Streptomyces nojiriensis TaxID=66374 RepID=A0ABQ3SKW3_9ACTN|nr:hypothetical protein GCM10010205_68870 [Streptomyces nojiriensis]GHI68612.1 hypothetical protein Snoj_25300 [Streptomyces nojiriensis]
MSAAAVLVSRGQAYASDSGDEAVAGAGGRLTFTFEAKGKGTTRLTLLHCTFTTCQGNTSTLPPRRAGPPPPRAPPPKRPSASPIPSPSTEPRGTGPGLRRPGPSLPPASRTAALLRRQVRDAERCRTG